MPNFYKIICAVGICFTLLNLTGCNTATGATGTVAGVGAATWFNNDRRTANAIIDDQAITAKANMALSRDKAVWKDSHVSTLTYNSSLLVVGQTCTQANKLRIEQIVTPIDGVNKVYNQVTIGPATSLQARTCDTWITTQVKSRLVSNRHIGLNRVKVITENSVVYLMGMLTKDEEEITIDIARRVPCVQKVVTIIERAEQLSTQPPCKRVSGDCNVRCK